MGAKSVAVEPGGALDAGSLELQVEGHTEKRRWCRELGIGAGACHPTTSRVSVPACLCWDQELALVVQAGDPWPCPGEHQHHHLRIAHLALERG